MSEKKEYVGLVDVPITKEEIDRCRYSSWYEKFTKHTPNSIIIKDVPLKFIDYLKEDGITLPNNNAQSFYDMNIVNDMTNNEYSDWEDDHDEEEDDDDDDDEEEEEEDSETREIGNQKISPLVDFPEFHHQVNEIIQKYRKVGLTPKLNWSAPRDATWILPYNNTMVVKEINDLYLLLNASNYIMHDIEYPYEDVQGTKNDQQIKSTTTYELVLREWFNINFALEFRIFIHKGDIIGVSQRDMKTHYEFLEELVPELKDRFDEFVYDTFLPTFYDTSRETDSDDANVDNQNIVLDVYIPRPFNKVWLIDCNPFSRSTDALLFSWNELITVHSSSQCNANVSSVPGKTDDYELRLVDQTSVGHRDHTENQMPLDIVQASLDPESLQELTRQWKETLVVQEQESASESDSN